MANGRIFKEDIIISKEEQKPATLIFDNEKRKILISLLAENLSAAHPIFRFHEKAIGDFLENKFLAIKTKDSKGMIWWEIEITPRDIERHNILTSSPIPVVDDDDEEKGD